MQNQKAEREPSLVQQMRSKLQQQESATAEFAS